MGEQESQHVESRCAAMRDVNHLMNRLRNEMQGECQFPGQTNQIYKAIACNKIWIMSREGHLTIHCRGGIKTFRERKVLRMGSHQLQCALPTASEGESRDWIPRNRRAFMWTSANRVHPHP